MLILAKNGPKSWKWPITSILAVKSELIVPKWTKIGYQAKIMISEILSGIVHWNH